MKTSMLMSGTQYLGVLERVVKELYEEPGITESELTKIEPAMRVLRSGKPFERLEDTEVMEVFNGLDIIVELCRETDCLNQPKGAVFNALMQIGRSLPRLSVEFVGGRAGYSMLD